MGGYMCARKTHEQFAKELFEVNPNIILLGRYVGCMDKILCQCQVDGYIFSMTPNNLLRGHGCPECKRRKISLSHTKTHEQFLYELSIANSTIDILGEYVGTHEKIQCKCKICGYIFKMTPHNLLEGCMCPKCRKSKGEKEVARILEKMNIGFIEQYRFSNCCAERPLPFDFYLPDYNICIEYQGGQHYFSVKFFGGEEKLKYRQNNDKIKSDYCKNNNINLIVIPYWDFNNIEQIIEDYLNNLNAG